MNSIDFIGFSGVLLLLLAFFLNLFGMIRRDSLIYILLNIFGAGIAAFASWLLHYLPFIILESTWTAVSIVALIRFAGRIKN
jgi:dolichyl-phosphate-mannose--protein O-mannosyl transferase